MPLDELESRIGDLDRDQPVLLICQSGQRAELAAGCLAHYGIEGSVLQGGTNAWKDAGLPLVTSSRSRWSLERQVRLAAGALVLAGVILALTVAPRWVYLAGLAGFGLTLAGLTDFCPMARLLGAMPWNGVRQGREAKRDSLESDATHCRHGERVEE